MKSQMNRSLVVMGLFVLGAVFALGVHHGQATKSQAVPSAIATIDIEKLYNGLTERSDADTRLNEMAKTLDATGTAKTDEITLLEADLKVYQSGTAQQLKAQQDLIRKTYEYQAFMEFATRKLNVEKADVLRNIYMSIKLKLEAYSAEHGYDVVFVNDSIVDLPTAATEAEMMRQISARRMLFSNDSVDITDAIIALMNDEYAQGK